MTRTYLSGNYYGKVVRFEYILSFYDNREQLFLSTFFREEENGFENLEELLTDLYEELTQDERDNLRYISTAKYHITGEHRDMMLWLGENNRNGKINEDEIRRVFDEIDEMRNV